MLLGSNAQSTSLEKSRSKYKKIGENPAFNPNFRILAWRTFKNIFLEKNEKIDKNEKKHGQKCILIFISFSVILFDLFLLISEHCSSFLSTFTYFELFWLVLANHVSFRFESHIYSSRPSRHSLYYFLLAKMSKIMR